MRNRIASSFLFQLLVGAAATSASVACALAAETPFEILRQRFNSAHSPISSYRDLYPSVSEVRNGARRPVRETDSVYPETDGGVRSSFYFRFERAFSGPSDEGPVLEGNSPRIYLLRSEAVYAPLAENKLRNVEYAESYLKNEGEWSIKADRLDRNYIVTAKEITLTKDFNEGRRQYRTIRRTRKTTEGYLISEFTTTDRRTQRSVNVVYTYAWEVSYDDAAHTD